jgi:hypothetical protein
MTNSILLTLYDDLEAMTVTYTDKSGAASTANCLNIDEKTDSIQTAHLPCRLLTTTLPDSVTIQRGGNNLATWNITDLFLLETVARDMGTFIQLPVLKRYEVAYSEALAKLWSVVHGWSTETLTLSLTMQAGKWEYPSGSGVYFYGVKCDLVMEELY